MLTRIVKMKFQPDRTKDFLELYDHAAPKIRNRPGCRLLELYRDRTDPDIYITFSVWESETSLEEYRSSDLFKDIWPRTRALFAEKPEVRSLDKVENWG
jgi:quinol monooxygenase YgiN